MEYSLIKISVNGKDRMDKVLQYSKQKGDAQAKGKCNNKDHPRPSAIPQPVCGWTLTNLVLILT